MGHNQTRDAHPETVQLFADLWGEVLELRDENELLRLRLNMPKRPRQLVRRPMPHARPAARRDRPHRRAALSHVRCAHRADRSPGPACSALQ